MIKMTDKKKKPDINEWKEQIEVFGDRLTDRMHDAIRLADEEADDVGIPEDLADCAMLGVFASMMVTVTAQRKIIGPDALIKLDQGRSRGAAAGAQG